VHKRSKARFFRELCWAAEGAVNTYDKECERRAARVNALTTTTIASSRGQPFHLRNGCYFHCRELQQSRPPTGKITFKDCGIVVRPAPLDSSANAHHHPFTELTGGKRSILATYSSDATHAATNSTVYTQTINKGTTWAALSSESNS